MADGHIPAETAPLSPLAYRVQESATNPGASSLRADDQIFELGEVFVSRHVVEDHPDGADGLAHVGGHPDRQVPVRRDVEQVGNQLSRWGIRLVRDDLGVEPLTISAATDGLVVRSSQPFHLQHNRGLAEGRTQYEFTDFPASGLRRGPGHRG